MHATDLGEIYNTFCADRVSLQIILLRLDNFIPDHEVQEKEKQSYEAASDISRSPGAATSSAGGSGGVRVGAVDARGEANILFGDMEHY